MRKYLHFFFYGTLLVLLLSNCVSASFYDYAEFNVEKAAEHIKQLKGDTIVIALTTYKDQEDIFIGAIKYGSKDVKKNKERLSNLRERRKVEVMNMINAFEEKFTFAEVLYMPDSLVHSFEMGEEKDYFLNLDGKIDASITYSNKTPIKILQQGEDQWTVVQGNKVLPNPFPNHYSYKNGLAVFFGLASHEKVSKNVASVLQARFEKFHSNPTRRVYL